MYHNIDDEAGFNTVSLKNFTEQIEYLSSKKEFSIVSIDQYIEGLGSSDRKLITLTFDDAYTSIKSKVLPVIKKYNVPITVFIPINCVGGYNTWDTSIGKEQLKILDWSEIKILSNEPLITFGSHGLSHISLGNVSRTILEDEIIKSKIILENEINTSVNYFSYPYGQLKDFSKNTLTLLKDCGYKAGFTTNWSRRNSKRNVYYLNRIEIRNSDCIKTFKKIINRKVDFKYYKQNLKNLLIKLKLYK